MSRFVRTLSLFLVGLPLLVSKGMATVTSPQPVPKPLDEPGAVPLRPLNVDADNRFAGHRSHSSHRSHASHSSHYSGSGGGSSYSAPLYAPPSPSPSPSYQGVDPGAPGTRGSQGLTSPGSTDAPPVLTNPEKLRLQIMRVQIRLTSLGLYDGRIDGVMNASTRTALERFQDVKGLPRNGMMTTPTMNALGITTVN